MTPSSSSFLRLVLAIDAISSGAMGLLLALAAGILEPLLGLPATLLDYAGVALVPFAALVAYVATRHDLPRPGVWAIIVCNAVWAIDSILMVLSGLVSPTALGSMLVVAQALFVAVLAALEYVALRQSTTVAA
jgi:hypothetical protein